MYYLRNLFNREVSQRKSQSVLPLDNESFTQNQNSYFSYHAKQITKGVLLFGAGILTYFGLNAVFGKRGESQSDELVAKAKDRLNLHNEFSNPLNPTVFDGSFESTPISSLLTTRTLLGFDKQSNKNKLNSERDKELPKFQKKWPIQKYYYKGYKNSVEKFENKIVEINTQELPLLQEDFKAGEAFLAVDKDTTLGISVVASLNNGGFVIVWEQYDDRSLGWNLYAQLYDAEGGKFKNKFVVNPYLQTHIHSIRNWRPAVASLTSGNFIISWVTEEKNRLVYWQQFSNTGKKIKNSFQVSEYEISYYEQPALIGLQDGGFVIIWRSTGPTPENDHIFGQLYNSEGFKISNEFPIYPGSAYRQSAPAVTSLNNGGFVVTWIGMQSAANGYNGIYGQRFDSKANKIGRELTVFRTTDSHFFEVDINRLNNNHFIVVWSSTTPGTANSHRISGQIFHDNGIRIGSMFPVNIYNWGAQQFPVISSLNQGGIIVVWQSSGQDENGFGIYAQCYDPDGYRKYDIFRINPNGEGDQTFPSVAALNKGDVVITWTNYNAIDGSYFTIYGRMYHMVVNLTNISVMRIGVAVTIGGIAACVFCVPMAATLATLGFFAKSKFQRKQAQSSVKTISAYKNINKMLKQQTCNEIVSSGNESTIEESYSSGSDFDNNSNEEIYSSDEETYYSDSDEETYGSDEEAYYSDSNEETCGSGEETYYSDSNEEDYDGSDEETYDDDDYGIDKKYNV